MANTAAYGARVLDRVMPKLGVDAWWDEIDLSKIWMSSVRSCILGQLFKGFLRPGFDQVEKFLIDRADGGFLDVIPAMQRAGFIESPADGISYEDLDILWAMEIRSRRELHAA
jgi:hypothetical protein